jgi:hypothetical protein
MKYEEAVKTLVDAWLLDKTDARAAAKALASPSVEFSCPARAEALVKAGLMYEANVETATATLENESDKEEKMTPPGLIMPWRMRAIFWL